jgi:hypothetical protein
MRISNIVTSLALFSMCSSAMIFAQPVAGPPCAGRCRGGGDPQGRLYDPKTVETLSGEILGLDRIAGRNGMTGVHADLKTDKGETIAVHLGPAWYLDKQTLTLKQGDKVTIRGSRVTLDDKPAIIAAEVSKQGETLRLRDDNGVPVWAGRGWRNR